MLEKPAFEDEGDAHPVADREAISSFKLAPLGSFLANGIRLSSDPQAILGSAFADFPSTKWPLV